MSLNGMLIFKETNKIIVESLSKEKTISIGRASNDDILLNSRGISRCHATIYFSDNSFWLIDGDLKGHTSTNGILVNGKKIAVHRLQQYDQIILGQSTYAFFLENSGTLEGMKLFENSALFKDFLLKLALFLDNQTDRPVLASRQMPTKDIVIRGTAIAQLRNPKLDDLTQLMSRSAFLERVNKSIEFKKNISNNHQFAILFIDLDRFKLINDSLGHLVGDKFLIEISERLKHCLRPNDTIARLGGDEFAILLDNLNTSNEAVSIAKRLQEYLAQPLQIDNNELFPSLSIGIALSYLGYNTVEEIMRDADTAMYHAKGRGRSRFVVFDQEMHEKTADLLRLHNDLQRAVEREEFKVYYQPIVSIQDGTLIGFEALIRWHHQHRGYISPEVFIPIAEETNLIYQIGQWVLQEACRQLSLWKQNPAIKLPLSMNVNLSAKQLHDARLIEKIKDLLNSYHLAPGELKLELTEGMVMENSHHSIKVFSQLKELGVQIAIDDFGTGYSSLSYLNQFPIDALKIDRSFTLTIDDSDENTSMNIIHSIITLAHSLGVKVVAEGIENLNHLKYLDKLKCDYGQGYLFSKPLNAHDATYFAENGIWVPVP